MLDDFSHDPNPPKWPHTGVVFNRWYLGLHAFIWALQKNFSPYRNPKGMRAKYLNIRVDTRNGSFLVYCEDAKFEMTERIGPDDLGLVYQPVELREVKFDEKTHAGNSQFW